MQDHFRAMGTDVTVVALDEYGISATRHWFETVEQVCSRFQDDSELSVVNQATSTEIALSPILAAVVREAQIARVRTDGLIDPAVGAVVRAWGYDRTFVEVRDLPEPPVRAIVPVWTIDRHVLRRASGVTLDLGGIAKGWACDVAIERGFAQIVSAGGDMRSQDPNATIRVADPWGDVVAEVPIGVGALATSSVTRRRWRVGNRDAHHLIDPRTGAPSDSPILSATVTARTAAEAEAGAKAVLLMGIDGLAWADRCPWIGGALAVWDDGSIYATKRMAA